MSTVVIGKAGSHNASIDVDVLLRTRMLIQANSGKGKSWLLRRLAEQLFGKIQVIIIDPEGEFATLREKFGYVLVGKGGETPAHPRSAALVAHKLLELKASAVCDLYEMKPATRHEWVQKFLDAMIDAPKNLWHPVVVMVDEAHVYCPEKGAGESIASEAMIGLATRGRKRGFSCIFATQRLGKLRKDAAAELLNVMIGGTFIDIDRKRAADALGVYGADQHKFFDEIKVLERGTFYALGPAIGDEKLLVKVGPVETSHPEAGSAKHAAAAPPAPEAIAKMLPKLADLPKTAEEKARTESEMRGRIRELESQLRAAGKVQPAAADPRAAERAVSLAKAKMLTAFIKRVEGLRKRMESLRSAPVSDWKRWHDPALAHCDAELNDLRELLKQVSGGEFKHKEENPKIFAGLIREGTGTAASATQGNKPRPIAISNGNAQLKAGARAMLTVLAQWNPDAKTRGELGVLTGIAPTGGTFGDYLSKLRTLGYITESGDQIAITEDGLAAIGDVPDRPSTSAELLEMWKSKFKAGARKMLEVLVEAGGEFLTREQLGEQSGVSASGGTFGDYLSQLRRARLIDEKGGSIAAAKVFFEL